MPTGISHGRKPPRIVRSQAPIVGALRNQVARYHRPDIDKHPAGRERSEELVPGALGEDPARHGKDHPSSVVKCSRGTISGTRYYRAPFPAIRYLGPIRLVTRRAERRVLPAPARQKGTFNRRHSYDPCAGTGDRVEFLHCRKLTVCRLTDP